MLRFPACGSLLLGALLLLIPEVALACSLVLPGSWTQRTPDGAFELSSRVGERTFGPATLSLREVRSGKVLWEHTLESAPHERQTHLSPSGRYVAVTDGYAAEFTLYGPEGGSQKLSLEPHLTPSEKRKLAESSCGKQWVRAARFEGEILVLDVPTAGSILPIYGQTQATVVRVDPKTLRLTRTAPVPEKSTAELIQEYRSSSEPEHRRRLVQELSGRSQDGTPGGDADLRRFWQELLLAPETPPRLLARAVNGLGVIGTEEEVRAMARLPAGPPERDLEILLVLERRAPQEAEAFGLRVLEERRQPELLRSRAVVFLSGRGDAVAEKASTLALSDPSAEVKRGGLEALARLPRRARAFEQALSFCQDPELKLRARVAESLRRILRDVKGTEREQALEVLRGAKERGQMTCFPEGYVILAGVADREKKRSQALALYLQGVKELEALPSDRRWSTSELRLEAKLQLAYEAKARGKGAELKKWAEEVLGDAHNSTFVCAPRPGRYAGTGGPDTCAGQQRAMDVARELLEGGRPAR